MKIVEFIASVITDDPDILNEEALATAPGMASGNTPGGSTSIGADKPLTATEISQEAEDIAGNKDSSKQVEDQIKAQEEAKKAEQLERQRLIKPQIQRLDQSLNSLNTGVAQTQANAQQSGASLDTEMATIRTLLGNLENTVM